MLQSHRDLSIVDTRMVESLMLYEGTDIKIMEFVPVKIPNEFPDAMQHIATMLMHYKHDSIDGQLMWPDLSMDKY